MSKSLILLYIVSSCILFSLIRADDRPNIVVFLADDVGYGDVNFGGHSIYNTTALNHIAQKGVTFSQLYSPTPLCTPSRAGLLTGRHPVRMGLAGNYSENPLYATEGVLQCDAAKGLPHTEKTIAQFLNETGYNTYMVGKWHLGHKEEYQPHTFGFQKFIGVPYAIDMGWFDTMTECRQLLGYLCPPMPLMGSSRDKNPGLTNITDTFEIIQQPLKKDNLTNVYLDSVDQYLNDAKSKKDEPFFLFMSYAQAHVDCKVDAFHSKESFLQDADGQHFRASIEEMDYMTGKIYNMLKEKNLTNNTILYFTSDNGGYTQNMMSASEAAFGAENSRGYANNGPFTGTHSTLYDHDANTGKCSTWEGGMRVPGFLTWEGREDIVKPNVISRQIYSLMDFLPTALKAANIKVPNNLDGIDMIENIHDTKVHNRFIHYYKGGSFYALRYGRWKFHMFTRNGDECGLPWWRLTMDEKTSPKEYKEFLIFDLETDQAERFAIKPQEFQEKYPDIYKIVVDEIREHKQNMKAPPSLLEVFEPKDIVCCDRRRNCHCDKFDSNKNESN